MDTQAEINADLISSIIPFPNLTDLSNTTSDFDNDIQILLDWLSPYIPATSLTKYQDCGSPLLLLRVQEPSQRVKSAIRGCLKDEINQIQFIELYINTINEKVSQFFESIVTKNLKFIEYVNIIKILLHYYNSQFEYLNLSDNVYKKFQAKLSFIITCNLLNEQSSFRAKMNQFFEESLYVRATLSNPLSSITLNLIDIISTLASIGMSDLLNEIVIKLSIDKIKHFTNTYSRNVWNKPLLSTINNFIQNEIYPNFYIVISYTTSSNLTDSMNNVYLYELVRIAHDELINLRIQEIYSMVLQYPESQVGLNELHYCLLKVKFNLKQYELTLLSCAIDHSVNIQAAQRTELVNSFIDYCHKNILHAGANTIDVITTYIKTIKSFLIVDPKGVLLDKVVRPIRQYLKTREDIIIKLVHGLLDISPNNELIELARELRHPSNKYRSKHDHSKDVLEDLLDLNWQPDPIDALPDFKKGKVSDIIESLISIFDSKDIFIDEFTRLFGDSLIKLKDYNVEEIELNLNLLKSRFGKQNFATLDVMIRDIKESEYLNDLFVRNTRNTNFNTSVLSHLYWSSILENINTDANNFKVPKEIEDKFQLFKDKFAQEKYGRTLELLPSLGLVTLQLEFKKSGPRVFKVTPDKASIISLFNEKEDELSVSYIAQTLNMSEYMVSNGLAYWVKEGVLTELTKTLYIVNDEEEEEEEEGNVFPEKAESSKHGINSATSNLTSVKSGMEDKFSEIAIIESYIVTILQNITLINFERMKTLLNLMVPKDKLDFANVSESLLEEYLDSLVENSKIAFQNGNYSLPK